MSREESSWCTIESDPGIFTLLIEKIGVKGVQVEEIYDLEANSLTHLPPQIYGFIFLFKWSKTMKPSDKEEQESNEFISVEDENSEIFFAQQEISNACATQAILHILLNNPSIELGEVLNNFRNFSLDLPADMRGLCLSNSLEIRQIHNEFGNLEELLAFGEDDEDDKNDKDKKSKDPFHFVAFIRKNDKIYELDGLKDCPIVHCKLEDDDDWRAKVLEIIKKRVGDGSEIRFNLMALVADQREALRAQIAEINAKIDLVSEAERPALVSSRFKAQQSLEDEEAKWLRFRKSWTDRQNSTRAIHQKQAPPIKLSSQVQDLLKSMQAKGLIPK